MVQCMWNKGFYSMSIVGLRIKCKQQAAFRIYNNDCMRDYLHETKEQRYFMSVFHLKLALEISLACQTLSSKPSRLRKWKWKYKNFFVGVINYEPPKYFLYFLKSMRPVDSFEKWDYEQVLNRIASVKECPGSSPW